MGVDVKSPYWDLSEIKKNQSMQRVFWFLLVLTQGIA
jgi:hypothetical protein